MRPKPQGLRFNFLGELKIFRKFPYGLRYIFSTIVTHGFKVCDNDRDVQWKTIFLSKMHQSALVKRVGGRTLTSWKTNMQFSIPLFQPQ